MYLARAENMATKLGEWDPCPLTGRWRTSRADHCSLSQSWKSPINGHLKNAYPIHPHLRWRRDALQPRETQRVRLDRNTCVHILDGIRCVVWNTRGLLESPFSIFQGKKAQPLQTAYSENDIVCLQEIHGKDQCSRLFRNWPRDSGCMVRLFRIM